MRWQDFDLLEEAGLTQYERKALVTLMTRGVSDADALCREGEIPTSKIYRAMEKLGRMRLAEIQPTRPKLYSALSAEAVVDRLVEISREKAESFAERAQELRKTFAELPGRLRGRKTFVDLALGVESHVKRHLIQVAAARRRILSYMERGDIGAIQQSVEGGFPILRRIARNAARHKIDHRVVFGFRYQSAPELVEFLQQHRAHLEHVTGVRYSGELGHPFHVVDEETVILALDHPFVPEGRFASLLVRDKELAQSLVEGFARLWEKAMRNLQEISFHPHGGD
ncbi:MAG: hypothetical protein GY953_47250 [bacterium]|nr:hypothetical protein [bacterium]